ncbi:hypothetical protein EGW08_005387 [Elysia chlorotica]|uniref:Reverse transcriptase domain-containing protein n=1 Tax=Elysia chlorotica TaxID=188477 RepID=A0A433TZ70_ELYCH|nr:hypothetical protein EGW08_005387 [Elysia chlorotica]
MATLRLKLRRSGPRPSGQRRFDVDKLKDNKTRSSFVLQVKNSFLTLSNLEQQQEPRGMEEVNRKWDHVHSAYLLASESCLGTKQRKRKEWISAETWETIEDRKDLKRKAMETKFERLKDQYREYYREADKTVKRKTRADKRAFIDDLASQAEEAAGRGEQGKVYKITKIVAGKYSRTSNTPITDKQGRLLTTESEQEARWTEHFREVLNRPPSTAEADIHFAEDWTEGIIVKIPKKGARSDCNNWRGITLLSIPSKILSKIIIQRISKAVDQKLRNEQAGFRKGRGCCDQIFTLRNIIEQCTEWQRQLYINFVDLMKAFDSIHRDSLWRILCAYGIPEKIVLIIKSFYSNFRCRVGNSSTSFEVKTGVRQGCVMSALLFNITIDWVMIRTTEDKSRGIRWNLFSTLEDLDFADDLALLSHTHNHMQEKTARLSNFAQQVGLKINKKKTEVMMLNISNQSPIEVNGENLPTTEEFTYLGSKVRHDGGAGTDIQSRLSKARNSFRMLNNVWRSSQYKVKTKAISELRAFHPTIRL